MRLWRRSGGAGPLCRLIAESEPGGVLGCGAARLLLSNRVIDPCWSVQMEALHAALKGYQVLMNTLMGGGPWPNSQRNQGAERIVQADLSGTPSGESEPA